MARKTFVLFFCLRHLKKVSLLKGNGSYGKESACGVGEPGSSPGSGISPGEGNSNPL